MLKSVLTAAVAAMFVVPGGAWAQVDASVIKKRPAVVLPGGPGPAPTGDAPAVSVQACVMDIRFQTGHPRHSVSGFARIDDGRLLSFAVSADRVSAILGTASGSITPHVAGAGTGFVAGAEPEIVRFIERAAADDAWITFDLQAAPTGSMVQQANTVRRNYADRSNCSGG